MYTLISDVHSDLKPLRHPSRIVSRTTPFPTMPLAAYDECRRRLYVIQDDGRVVLCDRVDRGAM